VTLYLVLFWETQHTKNVLFARIRRVFMVDEQKVLTLGMQSLTEPGLEDRSVAPT